MFAIPAGMLGASAPRPWVPRDSTEKEIVRAFKKASLHLHPDRLLSARRDLSVVVEAEEVLKVLNEAYGKKRSWLKGPPATSVRSFYSGPVAPGASRAAAPSAPNAAPAYAPASPASAANARAPPKPATDAPHTHQKSSTGASVREDVFGGMGGAASHPDSASIAEQSRVRAAVDSIFGNSGAGPGATSQSAGNYVGASGYDARTGIASEGNVARSGSGVHGESATNNLSSRPHQLRTGSDVRNSVFGAGQAAPPTSTNISLNPFGDTEAATYHRNGNSGPLPSASAVDDLFGNPGNRNFTRGPPNRSGSSDPFPTSPPHGSVGCGTNAFNPEKAGGKHGGRTRTTIVHEPPVSASRAVPELNPFGSSPSSTATSTTESAANCSRKSGHPSTWQEHAGNPFA